MFYYKESFFEEKFYESKISKKEKDDYSIFFYSGLAAYTVNPCK